MKMRSIHKISLSKEAIAIFKEQRLYSPINSKFVFPALTIAGHINKDSIGKAIQNLAVK